MDTDEVPLSGSSPKRIKASSPISPLPAAPYISAPPPSSTIPTESALLAPRHFNREPTSSDLSSLWDRTKSLATHKTMKPRAIHPPRRRRHHNRKSCQWSTFARSSLMEIGSVHMIWTLPMMSSWTSSANTCPSWRLCRACYGVLGVWSRSSESSIGRRVLLCDADFSALGG